MIRVFAYFICVVLFLCVVFVCSACVAFCAFGSLGFCFHDILCSHLIEERWVFFFCF